MALSFEEYTDKRSKTTQFPKTQKSVSGIQKAYESEYDLKARQVIDEQATDTIVETETPMS